LRGWVDETRDFCYYSATAGYHLLTPSLKHCSRFLRVGNMVRSVQILDQLAFWLLPEIAAADAILIDTWSIVAVILRALQRLGVEKPFDCLATHPRQDKKSGTKILGKLLAAAPPNPALVCIVSVNSSGSFLSDLAEITVPLQSRFRIVRPLCLYGFAGSPGSAETLCRLSDTVENYPSAEECALCKGGSLPVPIDPSLYHIKNASERDVLLGEDHFTGRGFLEKYQHVENALRLHRSDPNDGRHHAFDIDVLTLLADSGFKEAFLSTLGRLKPEPEVVITPNHEAGRAMGVIARERLHIPLIVHNDLRQHTDVSTSLSASDDSLLRASTHVLVVDDVLNTGTRLEEFNRSFREGFGQLKRIDFIVGVARPRSESEWKNAELALKGKHSRAATLAYVEKIWLPNWDEAVCPWCAEYDFLSSVSEKMPQPPEWLKSRISRLSERQKGIVGDPLLLLPGVATRSLGSESLFGPAGFSPLRVAFSLAAALQELRYDKRENRRLSPHFPDWRVFGIKNLQLYSESLLRAMMLRLLAPNEWGSDRRPELLRELISHTHTETDDILLGEILLALDRKVLIPLGHESFQKLYSQKLGTELMQFQQTLEAH